MKSTSQCSARNANGGFSTLRMPDSAFLLLIVCVCIQIASPAAVAQILTDPTRPPAGLQSSEAVDDALAAPVLQSVMISSTARSAIIGGKAVKLGGTYGDARVVKITENEVVLRSSGGTETLKMYPGVEMKPVKPAAPPVHKRARKSKASHK